MYKNKTKKIFFKGYYGYKNIGDDVFCATADWLTRNMWKKTRAFFVGENLPLLSRDSMKFSGRNFYLRKILELFISIYSNKIIYFGGSVFSKGDFSPKNIKYYYSKFKFLSNKLGTIGTSLGPFSNEKDYLLIKQFLSKFEYLGMRDKSSLKISEQMGFQDKSIFSFDLAILLTEVFPSLKNNKKAKERANNKIKLGVSLCHYERYSSGDMETELQREKAVLDFLNRIVEDNLIKDNIDEIVFFQFNGNELTGDLEITEHFYEEISGRINARIVHYTSNTEQFCDELSKMDFILGIRLHAGIISYALDIPFFLVEYHEKCTEFLNTINHNYRFDTFSLEENVNKFNELLKHKKIPDIIKPEFFKQKMLNALKEFGSKI